MVQTITISVIMVLQKYQMKSLFLLSTIRTIPIQIKVLMTPKMKIINKILIIARVIMDKFLVKTEEILNQLAGLKMTQKINQS